MPNKRTSSQANNKICLLIFFFVISFLFLPLLLLLFLYLAYYSFDLILPLLCFSFGNLFKIYIIKWVCIAFKCVICALLLPICVSLSVNRTNGRMGMWRSCGFQVDWVCYHNNKNRNQDLNSCSGETHIRRPLPPSDVAANAAVAVAVTVTVAAANFFWQFVCFYGNRLNSIWLGCLCLCLCLCFLLLFIFVFFILFLFPLHFTSIVLAVLSFCWRRGAAQRSCQGRWVFLDRPCNGLPLPLLLPFPPPLYWQCF